MAEPKRIMAKNVNFHIGVTSLGSKLSLQATKNNELEVTVYGVKATSKTTGRTVLIPFSNITGIELVPEDGAVQKTVINAPPRNLVSAKPGVS